MHRQKHITDKKYLIILSVLLKSGSNKFLTVLINTTNNNVLFVFSSILFFPFHYVKMKEDKEEGEPFTPEWLYFLLDLSFMISLSIAST